MRSVASAKGALPVNAGETPHMSLAVMALLKSGGSVALTQQRTPRTDSTLARDSHSCTYEPTATTLSSYQPFRASLGGWLVPTLGSSPY